MWTTPTNPVQNKRPLRFQLTDSRGAEQMITAVPVDFMAGTSADERWSAGVLDNIRTTAVQLNLEKGVQEISIGAVEAGLVLERILIYKTGAAPLSSYLGPPESFYTAPAIKES
jgi:hypothetical protein